VALTTDPWTQSDVDAGLTSAANLGRLKAVNTPAINGLPVQYRFQYNASGYLTDVTLPASLGTISYSPSSQFITSITYPTGAVSEYSIGLDVLGEMKSCVGPQEMLCWMHNGGWNEPYCSEGEAYQSCLETQCNHTTNSGPKK